MSENKRIQGMVRSIDQWRNMVPSVVVTGSMAQVEYALADAKTDIEALWLKVAALSSAAVAEREPVAWRWKPKGSEAWIYDPKHEWLEAQSRDEIDAEPLYLDPAPTSELEAENARLRAERDEATAYMRNLLLAFVGEHFPDNDGWKPQDDLVGMLTQIDNASTIAREYKARLAEALKALEPFAAVAEHDIGDDETDDDIFWPISNARYSMSGRLRVAHLRAARRVREGGNVDG